MATKPRSQPLPAKEENLLRQVTKLYDLKQYKKGIKVADQILKKFPDHGETLAFKALIVSHFPERRTEAHDLAKAALKADIKSFMCWHVYGLLHKGDRNYEQAAKCYSQALRMDPENMNIARDLCFIQMQLRDIDALVATAEKVLGAKSNARQHWLMLAIAHHLAGHHSIAVGVLEAYLGTQDKREQLVHLDKLEVGEIEMYMASIQQEAGNLDGALKVLNDRHSHICDRVGKLEMQGEIFLAQRKFAQAKSVYQSLIDIIPDNYEYHRGLCAALALPSGASTPPPKEVVENLKKVYADLDAKYPKCDAVKRIALDFLSGDDFAAAAEDRIRGFVRRGVPSLYSDLKALVRVPAKADALQRIAAAVLEDVGGESSPDGVWVRLFQAQLCAEMGSIGEAVVRIAAAEDSAGLAEAGAALDVLSAKADILAAAGDAPGAAAAAERARLLDLKDRYVNSMAAKFWFRAGDMERAKATALLFAVDFEGTASNLNEMQVMWYELESGRAHAAKGDLGMALKMFTAVIAHFAEFEEDQYDFHHYCLRKATLRGYIAMLRMEDRLYQNPTYCAAAVGAVDAYLALHAEDRPGKARKAEEEAVAGLPEAARKKALERRARDAKKAKEARAAALEKARVAHNAKKNAGKFDEVVLQDPKGERLLEDAKPLDAANVLVQVLRKHAPDELETQRVAFAVARRRKKPFLAVHAVKQALHLGADDPRAHRALVELTLWLGDARAASENEVASGVLADELAKLTGGKSCQELNDEYAKRCAGSSLAARLAAAQCALLLNSEQPAKAAAHLSSCDLASIPHSVSDAAAAHAWLKDACKDEAAAQELYAQAQAVHRWSSVFEGPERLPLPEGDGLSERLQAMSVTAAAAADAKSSGGVPTEAQTEAAQAPAQTAAIPVDAQMATA